MPSYFCRELLIEREKAEQRLKETLEAEIKAKEVQQEERIKQQMESWAAEKERLESALKTQWETQMQEKEADLEKAKAEKERQLEMEFKQKEASFLEKMQADKAALMEEKNKVNIWCEIVNLSKKSMLILIWIEIM